MDDNKTPDTPDTPNTPSIPLPDLAPVSKPSPPQKTRKMDLATIIRLTRKGMTYKEIAKVLDTTEQVIRNTVYRAGRYARSDRIATMSSHDTHRKKVKKLSEKEIDKLAKQYESYAIGVKSALKEENKGRATAINVHIAMCAAMGAKADVENINSLYAAFENYIKLCAENDVPMTMSTACLAIGVSKSTLATWRAGKTRTEDYREFAESVVYAVQAGLEAMMATGLVNPVVGIWWEKSHFGMVEATKGEAVESDPLGSRRTAEEIAAEYEGVEDLPT